MSLMLMGAGKATDAAGGGGGGSMTITAYDLTQSWPGDGEQQVNIPAGASAGDWMLVFVANGSGSGLALGTGAAGADPMTKLMMDLGTDHPWTYGMWIPPGSGNHVFAFKKQLTSGDISDGKIYSFIDGGGFAAGAEFRGTVPVVCISGISDIDQLGPSARTGIDTGPDLDLGTYTAGSATKGVIAIAINDRNAFVTPPTVTGGYVVIDQANGALGNQAFLFTNTSAIDGTGQTIHDLEASYDKFALLFGAV